VRILVCPSAYHPHKGGVEEAVRQLALVYRRSGHEVLIVAPRWPHALPSSEVVDGQLVLRVPMPLPSRHWRSAASFFLRFVPSVAWMLKTGARWRPDIVHVQCVGPNGFYALILTAALQAPLVVTSHGEQSGDANRIYQRSAVQRLILRQLLRRADEVTACSAHALGRLRWYGDLPSDAAVIPNGVNLAEIRDGLPEMPHPRPYVFAIGRHVWNKGFDLLMRAFAGIAGQFPDVDLIIAGDGPEHARLLALAERLSLAGRMHFPGYTDRAATVRYFRHCDLFVSPSREESFGIANLEAMAAAKAIVATRVGGVPEIVHDGRNGLLVSPDNPAELGTAIARLLENPSLACAFGRKGAALVEQRYRWERVAADYLVVYSAASRGRVLPPSQGPRR